MDSSAIRMPKRFSSTFISRHFFFDYFSQDRLATVNNGQCYDWAYFAHRLFGVQLWTTDYHAWVEVWKKRKLRPGEIVPKNRMYWPQERRWFDSETIRGVKSFTDLASHIRLGGSVPWGEVPAKAIDLQEFKELWNEIGAGYTYHWDSILEPKLVRVLGKHYKVSTPILQIKP